MYIYINMCIYILRAKRTPRIACPFYVYVCIHMSVCVCKCIYIYISNYAYIKGKQDHSNGESVVCVCM